MSGLVISGGRVVDPASGMDAIGDVAVLDGQISAVGTGLGSAERVIDATGLVVAPGFIDLHAHGQSIPADRMQAFDGVTTSLDLEAGVLPVASMTRSASPSPVPTAEIRPSSTATSPIASIPLAGSTTRPPRITNPPISSLRKAHGSATCGPSSLQ